MAGPPPQVLATFLRRFSLRVDNWVNGPYEPHPWDPPEGDPVAACPFCGNLLIVVFKYCQHCGRCLYTDGFPEAEEICGNCVASSAVPGKYAMQAGGESVIATARFCWRCGSEIPPTSSRKQDGGIAGSFPVPLSSPPCNKDKSA